jgi:hypothetical protein
MAQVSQKLPLKEATVAEIVATALFKKRKQNKASRRITVFLKPSLIPPKDGFYETGIGEVKLKSVYKPEQGRWIVVVVLPPEEFKLRDHLSPSDIPSAQ